MRLPSFSRFIRLAGLVLTLIWGSWLYASDRTPSDGKELVFLTWSEYMDPDLVVEFESKYNTRIKEIYFETDELKDEMLVATDGSGYDVVLTSGFKAISYKKRKWLAAFDDANVPNINNIDPKWLTAYPEITGYAVPYLWGTLGFAYRKDLVPGRVDSWKHLLEPVELLRKKIVMIKDSRDTIGAALKYLGCSWNSGVSQHYGEAERLLLAQKRFVQTYSYVVLTEQSALVTGKAWMAMIYNGDALVLHEHHPQIAYVVPKEGTNIWVDYLVVLKASKRKERAFQFIDFLNEPRNAARLASFLMFATPNKAAEKFLDPEHLHHPMIYPEKAVLEKSEISRELPPRIVKKCNSIFAQLIR